MMRPQTSAGSELSRSLDRFGATLRPPKAVLQPPPVLLVLVLLLIPFGASFAQSGAADWPQYRYDTAHTGLNPNETVLNSTSVRRLRLDWMVTLGVGGTGLGGGLQSGASIVGGVLYQQSQNGNLYVLNAASGLTLGITPTASYSSQPAVVNGRFYVGTFEGIKAYPVGCAAPCTPVWVAEAGSTFNPAVTVADGVVYGAGYGGRVVAIDAASGQFLWSGIVNVTSTTNPDPLFGSVAVSAGMVFAPGSLGLYAFPTTCRGRRCRPAWIGSTDFGLPASPAIAGGVVYAADYQGSLYAWDAATGALQWRGSTSYQPGTPAIAAGVLYLTTGDGGLWAFATSCAASTCAPLWRTSVGQALFEPVVANGVVYVGSLNFFYTSGTLFAFPASCCDGCRPLWSQAVEGAIESPPTVAGGVVYAGTVIGRLYAFGLR